MTHEEPTWPNGLAPDEVATSHDLTPLLVSCGVAPAPPRPTLRYRARRRVAGWLFAVALACAKFAGWVDP